jgi:uncharacterized membrane protein HdeD (DUF308 family)
MITSNPFIDGITRGVRMAKRDWWLFLVDGLLGIVAGGIILAVDWTVADLAVFIGALFVMRGFLTMASRPLDGGSRGWTVALGLAEVAVGTAVWAWPAPTLLVVALWVGWWLLFGGVMTIVASVSGRDVLPSWGLLLAFGIVQSALAVYFIGHPGLTLLAVVFAVGFWSITYGVVRVVIALELRRTGNRVERFVAPSSRRPHRDPTAVAN